MGKAKKAQAANPTTSRGWLVAMTGPNQELSAQYHLRRQGFRVWLWHRMPDKPYGPLSLQRRPTKPTFLPFFSRYLFVADNKRHDVVNETDGVATILHHRDAANPERSIPLIVPDRALQQLAQWLGVEADGFIPEDRLSEALHPTPPMIAEGDPIRVIDGPFAHFLGRAAEAAPLDGRKRIHAFIDIFGRKTKVELEQGQFVAATA